MSRAGRAARRAAGLLAIATGLAGAAAAPALEAWDGRANLHGFGELQLRGLADGFDPQRSYLAQWAWTLDLEGELDLAPGGLGPFELLQLFARVEVRHECVFTGCGIANTHRYFGDRAGRAPARNWTDATTPGFSGDLAIAIEDVHRDRELLDVTAQPLLEPLKSAGADEALAFTLGPVLDDVFAYKTFDNSIGTLAFQLGPWRPESTIQPNGALASIPAVTLPAPPLLRPNTATLYSPSAALRERLPEFDDFDQNFSQDELAWNHGGGQDEHELKELYLDVELFDARAWLRLGKQSIVWGKTELFRTADQFNPQDIGLASLPTLEESRLPLWSVRGTWSFYDVGPLEDVRLELAANLDDFEPVDIGRCGEPYTVWLLCGKAGGLFGHGVLGAGLAGELRPPDPWDSWKGIEVGARVEWRWDRFSFALSDFYGYSDAPAVELFHEYERTVDPRTGRPLDARGQPLETAQQALDFPSGNRQIFDVTCSATVGIAGTLIPELADRCVLDLLNSADPVPILLFRPPAGAIGVILAGSAFGDQLANLLGDLMPFNRDTMVELNVDPADGPGGGLDAPLSLSARLTDEQEALLGCGPFYQSNCDEQGIDLFNAEASAVVQSFPMIDPRAPVATRFVDGALVVLPGARNADDPAYDPLVDGCVGPGPFGCNDGDLGRVGDARLLQDQDPVTGLPTGEVFENELAAVSRNLAVLLAVLELRAQTTNPDFDSECVLDDLTRCEFVRAIAAVTGVRRPEQRAGGNGSFGRRDFYWHGGGEAQLRYAKRNVLGLSLDFAEDRSKSNWSLELTWFDDSVLASNRSASLTQEADAFNLTVSVDRPTFVNFLNPFRTFFVNSQFFFQWIPDHDQSFDVHGPFSALGTLTVTTGYFQDRLLPSVTFVHDLGSASGALIPQVAYRFTPEFSASFGVAAFYGGPESLPASEHPLFLTNQGGDFRSQRSYGGLSAIAERDELFLRLRYTF